MLRRPRKLLAPADPNAGDGGSGGAANQDPPADPPKDPPAAPPADDGSGKPFAVFETKEAFEERLRRQARSLTRDEFGEDPEAVKEKLQKYKEMQAAEEERKKQEMTENERLKAERDEFEKRAAAADLAREEAMFSSDVTRQCAQLGIKDVDYARYLIDKKAKEDGGKPEDIGAFLAEKLKTPSARIALGIDDVPNDKNTHKTGANTSTEDGNNNPPPQDPPNPSGDTPDATKMSREEFNAHLQSLGVSV